MILHMKDPLKAFFFLLCFFLVFACSKASYPESASMDYSDSVYGREREEKPEESPSQYLAAGEAEPSRKLVKNAELGIRVDDPASTEKPLSDLMEKYRAWPASSVIYENSREYSIRVPSSSFDAMLTELAGLGKTLRRMESAEDVTLRYYDLESRLATKRELLKTFQGYLGRAKDIDEIMTVEKRIAELQQEIDQTGTQLRNLAGLVDYSTISLRISGPQSAYSYAEPTLWEKLKSLFGSFGNVVSTALVVLTGIVIYGVPAILIVVLLYWLLFGRVGLIKKLWRLAARK